MRYGFFIHFYSFFLHVYFWKQDQCSWSGSSGHAKGDADVRNIFGEELVRARRAELTCNGIKLCTFTDRTLLEGFEGWERNSGEMKDFSALELQANEDECRLTEGPLARCVGATISNIHHYVAKLLT
jgi:hypothetical protein